MQHHQHLPSIETKNLFQTQLKIFLKLFLLSSFHLKCLTAAVDPSFKEGGWMSCKNPEGNMERQICRIYYILPKDVNRSMSSFKRYKDIGFWLNSKISQGEVKIGNFHISHHFLVWPRTIKHLQSWPDRHHSIENGK